MGFYHKLARTNINQNRKFYYPYIFSAIFTSCLFYIVRSLYYSESLANRPTLSTFMSMGTYVIMIFATVFLLYGNSFVIKNRKKEISLYNILGMEKRHVMVMMLLETMIVAAVSIIAGVIMGILLGQLMDLLITNLIHAPIEFALSVSFKGILETALLYLTIFLVSMAVNVLSVQLTKPIELLKGGNIGEKEPKTKLITTMIGLVALGAGYYIALTITDPVLAIALFLVAVILVMIGTYCLFTAGSITLLKLLRKNKRYYYQTRHFTAISGLLYRMKQNAIGLANICILCTCVLVTFSSTFCMYIGIQESVDGQCPADQIMVGYAREVENNFEEIATAHLQDLDYYDYFSFDLLDTIGIYHDGHVVLEATSSDSFNDTINLNALSQDTFNQGFNQSIELQSNQVVLYTSFDYQEDDIWIDGVDYQVVGTFVDPRIMVGNYYAPRRMAVIFANGQIATIPALTELIPGYAIGLNSDDPKLEATVDTIKNEFFNQEGPRSVTFLNHDAQLQDSYEVLGSLLFIGIFMSVMFLMAAIMIIYNKQLSEGYEDQNKFEILQNVGMSQKEVKQAIKSQVLVFFFLPLIVAIIHLAFAFPLILRVLRMALLGNVQTYFIITIITVAFLAAIYCLVYLLTARTYYQIVKK